MLVGLGSQMNDTVTILAWLYGLCEWIERPRKEKERIEGIQSEIYLVLIYLLSLLQTRNSIALLQQSIAVTV